MIAGTSKPIIAQMGTLIFCLLILPALLSSCDAPAPEAPEVPQTAIVSDRSDCRVNFLNRRCVITVGNYEDFVIGMPKAEAFEVACNMFTRNEILSTVRFYPRHDYTLPGLASICALEAEAMRSEEWELINVRRNYLVIKFSEDAVSSVEILFRGFDL